MKTSTIAGAESVIRSLQDEIRRPAASRYDHRLHGVLLVHQGMSCPEVARLLGDATRTVEYWVRRFEKNGFAGLLEKDRPGRPKRLNETQSQAVDKLLGKTPREAGVSKAVWDGKTLSAWLRKQYGIELGLRQCQRILGQFDLKSRKRSREKYKRLLG